MAAALRRPSSSFHSERGFTLVEVLAAVALISVGVAATFKIFGAVGHSVLRSERTDVAVQQAQAELDRLRTLPYGQIAMKAEPTSSSDPYEPGSRVESGSLRVRSDLSEPFVMSPGDGQAAMVDVTPKEFAVGLGGATITGRLYAYVTWRDENCPFALCPGNQNTKRLTVAVALDRDPSITARRRPMWFSTIVADPNSAPPGTLAPPGGGPSGGDPVTAQSFFLYDTPCGQTTHQAPAGEHPTHDTASSGASAADYSTCDQSDPAKQPDLMGETAPAGDRSTPLYKYSAGDVAGGYDGGLTMLRHGSTCAASYAASDASNNAALSKWSVHAWSTAALSQPFTLGGLVTASLFTTTVNSVPAAGRVCVTLIDRQTDAGVPTDRVLGTGVYDLSNWPTDVRRIGFSFRLAQQEVVPAGHRLVMALHLRGESGADISLLYDHPLYPSLLEVATSTPL